MCLVDATAAAAAVSDVLVQPQTSNDEAAMRQAFARDSVDNCDARARALAAIVIHDHSNHVRRARLRLIC